MVETNQTVRAWMTLVVGLSVFASITRPQESKRLPPLPADGVKALIDRLTELDQQDTGYSGSLTGSAFLPLGQSETNMILFGQKPRTSSDAMKALVSLGTKALPTLLRHLSDDRQTKILLTHEFGLGGMFIGRDEDEKKERPGLGGEQRYTVMVGDLCYVAIGQIVNRNYAAVWYQPTGIIFVTSVPKSKKVRETLLKEWSKLTPAKHRDSLARDLGSDQEAVRNGASLRLAYFYPEALEPLALNQLERPTYNAITVQNLIRDRLYSAKTAKDRKLLVEQFVSRNGAITRDAIRWDLFHDLERQEADEEGRVFPKLDPRHRARECLIDVSGLPATVKSSDRPPGQPLEEAAQARFVRTLRDDRSEKLERALRDMLGKTNDDYLA